MSEIGKLAAALAKAQGQMKGAIKDAANPFFKSKYADLASTWDACREALSANELSVTQPPDLIDGQIVVRTILMHASGESITSILPIFVGDKATAQQIGSGITYARRYALAAIVGVAPEDDDGNSASEAPSNAAKWAKSKPGESDNLKQKVTEFVRKLEMCESLEELEKVEKDNVLLIAQVDTTLPAEWAQRLHGKIEECKGSFAH